MQKSSKTLAIEKLQDVLTELGLDLTDESLVETPGRIYRAWAEFCEHRNTQLVEVLGKQFTSTSDTPLDEFVMVRDIQFSALCAHHFFPFYGHAAIAYLPNKRLVGLSKLSRLVTVASHQAPTLQEYLTRDIGMAISKALQPQGVFVVMEAVHTCASCRGARSSSASTITSYVSGIFRTSSGAKMEVLSMWRGK